MRIEEFDYACHVLYTRIYHVDSINLNIGKVPRLVKLRKVTILSAPSTALHSHRAIL
jgi:hypothetical protein